MQDLGTVGHPPLHKDVLSYSQRVDTGQDPEAGQLHIIH